MSSDRAFGTRHPGSTRTRRWAIVVVITMAITACSGSDATTADAPPDDAEPAASAAANGTAVIDVIDGVNVERRSHLGPRAIDAEREMTLAVDSMQLVDDEILVRVRVTNDGDQALAIGAENTWYGPLIVLHDDLTNGYAARAVEPAGVYAHSTALLDLRLDGPLDPDATEFTVELSTDRGPLETEPGDVPDGDAVRWWSNETSTSDMGTFAELPHLPDLIHAQISNDSATQPVLGPPADGSADE